MNLLFIFVLTGELTLMEDNHTVKRRETKFSLCVLLRQSKWTQMKKLFYPTLIDTVLLLNGSVKVLCYFFFIVQKLTKLIILQILEHKL